MKTLTTTITSEEKRNKHRNKSNYEKKTKYRTEDTVKIDQEVITDSVKNETPRKIKTVSEEQRKIFLSTIDPFDAPLKWWEKEHVKYAINYPPVKSRLEKVMGTHIVRLTDRKYMSLLAIKLLEDHVKQQKTRIKRRKLSPPLIISRLLELSYKTLKEKMKQPKFTKLKLYV
ncbi:uncharacterized protein LOC108626657 [Ceratina calcarata]|uniref:Uncharacterized protein LOC108626657 n=1 Tax=Ceratina calcarata TaxID=156304 RepID=A0AAJ7N8G8_9HYME|nr:uncharacterized protein LOC108626657 [Ceratina calcarata]